VPGDPEQVRADGQHCQDVAGKLGRISGTLGALSTGATTGSRSVESLMEGARQVRADVDAARGRHQAAGDALVGYAHVHYATLRALYAARAAKRDQAVADWDRAARVAVSKKGTRGMNMVTKIHVEAHAAAIMRLDGLKTATLCLIRAPCAGITGCEHLLPRMVPAGSELLIHIVPNGSPANIVGTLLVEGAG